MKSIKTPALTGLVILGALLTNLSASGEQPLRSAGFVFEDRIVDAAGNPPADDALIYSKGGQTEVCTTPYLDLPVLAPDGHHVTAGEWREAEGRASVKCTAAGTHVVIHLSGLIPEGVYTIWLVPFKAPGFDGTFDNLIGLGALGSDDGSQNTIVANVNGQGQLSVFHPAGALSMFGETTDCLEDEFEFHLLAAYHIDGMTYGMTPGSSCTWLESYAWVFLP